MMDKVAKHADICKALNELYQRKNADYGDSFGKSYTEYGMTMACIRLEDKLNRLKSLCKKEAQVADESMEDTLMDLANYAIMTLVEREKQKTEQHWDDLISEAQRHVLPLSLEEMEGDHTSNCHKNCLCKRCANASKECCFYPHGGKVNTSCPLSFCPDFVPEGDG